MASSSQANIFVLKLLKFRAKHSGVSNPSLDLSYRVLVFRITFVIVFRSSDEFSHIGWVLILFWILLVTRFTPRIISLG